MTRIDNIIQTQATVLTVPLNSIKRIQVFFFLIDQLIHKLSMAFSNVINT